jgi:hypothetical protein
MKAAFDEIMATAGPEAIPHSADPAHRKAALIAKKLLEERRCRV